MLGLMGPHYFAIGRAYILHGGVSPPLFLTVSLTKKEFMKKPKKLIRSSKFDIREDKVITFTASGMIEIQGNENGSIDILVRPHIDKWSYRPPNAPPQPYKDRLRLDKKGHIEFNPEMSVN